MHMDEEAGVLPTNSCPLLVEEQSQEHQVCSPSNPPSMQPKHASVNQKSPHAGLAAGVSSETLQVWDQLVPRCLGGVLGLTATVLGQ